MTGWIYLLGYLWFWRYHIGYFLEEFADGADSADGADWFFGIFIASIVTAFWPITVAFRTLYVVHQKYFDNIVPATALFPGAKAIETKGEKIQRHQREQRLAIDVARQHTNDRERELGFPLTKWSDT